MSCETRLLLVPKVMPNPGKMQSNLCCTINLLRILDKVPHHRIVPNFGCLEQEIEVVLIELHTLSI